MSPRRSRAAPRARSQKTPSVRGGGVQGSGSPRCSDAAGAARVLDRVAVLVGAGVPPPRAWALVGGLPEVDAPAWQDVRLVLRVADHTGAPSSEALHALAAAMRRTAASDRAVRVALSGPRTSARVVLALPLLGLGLGSVWGAGAVDVLLTRPVGWVCILVAAGLVLVAQRWTRRLVDAVTPDGHVPGILLDAWAVALGGGGSWGSAAAAVQDALAAAGYSDAPPGPDPAGRPIGRSSSPHVLRVVTEEAAVERLHEVLVLSRRAGVPAVGLLRAAAEDTRDDAAAAGLASAERLAVRLVLPLGVCVLPAFVLVGVVPVVVGVLSSTVGGLR